MSRRRKPREKGLTDRFLAGELTETDEDGQDRFGSRSKDAEQGKILRTAILRAGGQSDADVQALPIGQVVQVYSLFYEVQAGDQVFLCVVRKTLNRRSDSAVLVGDRVRFLDLKRVDEQGRRQAVIEQVLPRDTVLTRADSFKGAEQHPIVANADQMLIVASLWQPPVKWGLIDRMVVAALSGKLQPVICLNKIDLSAADDEPEQVAPQDALAYYRKLGVGTLQTSVPLSIGLDELRAVLAGKTTVLSGHSGVGKSTLLNAIQPSLDLKTGAISDYTGKGRHTTTSARRYPLDGGGAVIDTPGVKLFGLWGVSPDNLIDYFPDVADESAPAWRVRNYEQIVQSIR